jgi:hypothetical protein
MSDNQPRQPLSVYTVMLIAATIFMTLACIIMAIEWSRYQGAPPTSSRPSSQVFALESSNGDILRNV